MHTSISRHLNVIQKMKRGVEFALNKDIYKLHATHALRINSIVHTILCTVFVAHKNIIVLDQVLFYTLLINDGGSDAVTLLIQ